MKFYELTVIGEFHTNHNEDFLISEDAGESKRLIAVMDGCSSGTDSHFASTLIGKLLRKIAKQEAYREFAQRAQTELPVLIKKIAIKLFEELGVLNRQLDLGFDEILSTLILGIIDTKSMQAEFVIVGDGVIHVDGENIEYENGNKPDYIGYHLDMDKRLWYRTKTQKMSVDYFNDMTISTDGIHTFKNFDGKTYKKISEEDIMTEFFVDKSNIDNPNKLKKSLIKIKKENGLMPSDDLTMIRVINEHKKQEHPK